MYISLLKEYIYKTFKFFIFSTFPPSSYSRTQSVLFLPLKKSYPLLSKDERQNFFFLTTTNSTHFALLNKFFCLIT